MRELKSRDLERDVYLWSDDNLSTDYFWRFLSEEDIDLVQSFRNYGRVCCFKGYDEESFSFNTLAEPPLFSRQFDLFGRFVDIELDVYAYVTLTTPNPRRIGDGIKSFLDRLQAVHENLPLRTVPLEIKLFTPVHRRMSPEKTEALENQQIAIEAWHSEVEDRYPSDMRALGITQVDLSR